MAGVLMMIWLSSTPLTVFAQAQQSDTLIIDQLQLKLEELLKQLAILKAKEDPDSDASISVGTSIVTVSNTRIREVPGLNLTFLSGSQSAGNQGKIIAGPKTVDGITWFKIDYKKGADGWVDSNLIKRHSDSAATKTSPKRRHCSLTTDKKQYTVGEYVTFKWNAPEAKFVIFSNNNGGKDGIRFSEGIFEKKTGTTRAEANFIGSDKVTLEVHTAYGQKPIATCSTTVNVEEIERSFGIKDIISVTKEVVDPLPSSKGDEYETYTIILKSGDSFTMAIAPEQYADRGAIFEANGYTGSLSALLKIAK